MFIELFQYKGIFRRKILKLLLNKYHVKYEPNLLSVSKKSQVDLLKELIYYYSLFNNEIDLKKLAEFYFSKKDYYYDSIEEKADLSIILRWEIDLGISLMDEIKKRKVIDGSNIDFECQKTNFNFDRWNFLFEEILYYIIANCRNFNNTLLSGELIKDHLNLDFMPLRVRAFNSFDELKNLSIDNVKISDSDFIWPKSTNLVFKNLYLENTSIYGIDFKDSVYVDTIILNKSMLHGGSLISPTDKLNNIHVTFQKASMLKLFKILIFRKKPILFSELDLAPGTSIRSKELYDYYNWYTYYALNDRGKNKFVSFVDILVTKYYTSILNVFISSLIFIISYAGVMYGLDLYGDFFTFKEGTPKNFWSYLYMSMTNFTTLGFGEIVASHPFSYLVVSLEVLTGYFMLAMLVAIVAKREMKYS